MSSTHSTTAADAARDRARVVAFQSLEDDICSLLNMARILADLLDGDLVGIENGEKIHMPEPGNAMQVYLTHDQMECLSFAWNDVITRSFNLKNKYYAAWDVGVAA